MTIKLDKNFLNHPASWTEILNTVIEKNEEKLFLETNKKILFSKKATETKYIKTGLSCTETVMFTLGSITKPYVNKLKISSPKIMLFKVIKGMDVAPKDKKQIESKRKIYELFLHMQSLVLKKDTMDSIETKNDLANIIYIMGEQDRINYTRLSTLFGTTTSIFKTALNNKNWRKSLHIMLLPLIEPSLKNFIPYGEYELCPSSYHFLTLYEIIDFYGNIVAKDNKDLNLKFQDLKKKYCINVINEVKKFAKSYNKAPEELLKKFKFARTINRGSFSKPYIKFHLYGEESCPASLFYESDLWDNPLEIQDAIEKGKITPRIKYFPSWVSEKAFTYIYPFKDNKDIKISFIGFLSRLDLHPQRKDIEKLMEKQSGYPYPPFYDYFAHTDKIVDISNKYFIKMVTSKDIQELKNTHNDFYKYLLLKIAVWVRVQKLEPIILDIINDYMKQPKDSSCYQYGQDLLNEMLSKAMIKKNMYNEKDPVSIFIAEKKIEEEKQEEQNSDITTTFLNL